MVLSKIFISEHDSRFLYCRVKVKTYPLILNRLLTPRVLVNTITNLFHFTFSEFCCLEGVCVCLCVRARVHVYMHVYVCVWVCSIPSVSVPA